MNTLKPVATLLVAAVFILLPGIPNGGELDPPASPDETAGAMHTLEDLYNRLDTGAEGTPPSGGFTGPSVPPSSSTMHTLNAVMAKMPAPDNTDGAKPEEVAKGKKFWSLRTDGTWGVATGTATSCLTCEGTLHGTRWCDNGDGTITDMTTGLVWLKDIAQLNITPTSAYGASVATHGIYDGANGVQSLNDGSNWKDWRLPSEKELNSLQAGPEAAGPGNKRGFATFPNGRYWTSTIDPIAYQNGILFATLLFGVEDGTPDFSSAYICPVRNRRWVP